MTEYDIYQRYIRDVARHPRISSAREAELSRIIKMCPNREQVEAAVSELIHANLLLVVHCQKGFEKYRASVRLGEMDLIAEGNIGLMKAARNYDCGYDTGRPGESRVRFSTYACKCIKSCMIRALKKARFIHIPEHHFSYWSEMEALQREHGGELSDDDLRRRMDISEEALSLVRHSAGSRVCMLEDLGAGEGDGGWNDFLPSTNTAFPNEEADRHDLRAFLMDEMDTLAPRTRQMLTMLYFNETAPTLKDIGGMFGISSERCRQICQQGLKQLKRRLYTRRHAIDPGLATAGTCAA